MGHVPSKVRNGSIDGTVRCSCGWYKYVVYPGAGWGRYSVGIQRRKDETKPMYLDRKMLEAYAEHISQAIKAA